MPNTQSPATLAEAIQAIKRIRERVGSDLICCGSPVKGDPGDGYLQPPDGPQCCQCPEDVGALLDTVLAALLSGAQHAAGRRQGLEEARAKCEAIADEYQRREGRRFPELKSDAESGANACDAAIRDLMKD